MIRIFICPECKNYRFVSKKLDSMCLQCDVRLKQCAISYLEFINMTEQERQEYKDTPQIP